MNLANFAIKHPVTVTMLVVITIVLGFVSFAGVGIDLFPEIDLPIAVAITTYSGAGPREIETLVTKPIESSLSTVSDMKEIASYSSNGTSMVMVQFEYGTDMDFAGLKMREKLDMVKRSLPSDASDPMIVQFDPSLMPVLNYAVMCGDTDINDVKNMVEDKVVPRLERIGGVAQVSVSGAQDRVVTVNVIPERMEAYGLSLPQVTGLLRSENLSQPAGKIVEGTYEYTVRTTAEYTDVEEIKSLVLSSPKGAVRLGDIAEVSEGYRDKNGVSYMTGEPWNGEPCLSINIQKQSSYNTVQVANKVNAEMAKLAEEISGFKYHATLDQSIFIQDSIDAVTQNGIIGAVLAVIILFVFLRNFRATLIVSISIPVSIIATFVLIYFSGITLNLMSLGGLVLGIGMLVDNSIVVIETIYRHQENGLDRVRAAREGTEEVLMAVTASTLTTIVVFLPIIFIRNNIAMMLFRELAMTVTFSLISSLVVSVTIVPMLASKILKVDAAQEMKGISKKIEDMLLAVEANYGRFARWSLHHRRKVLFVSVLLFIVSIVLAGFSGMEFYPSTDEGEFSISIELPSGSSLDELVAMAKRVEDIVNKVSTEQNPIKDIYVSAGGGDNASSIMGGGGGESTVSISAKVTGKGYNTDKTLDKIRSQTQKIAGAKITLSKTSSGMGAMSTSGGAISVEIKGDEVDRVSEIADELVDKIAAIEGTREVKSSVGKTLPEAKVTVNRDKAGRYGISAATVASTVQTAVMGSTAAKYRTGGTELDIVVSYPEDARDSLSLLGGIKVPSSTGYIPLAEVADITIDEAPATITRSNQVRYATVTGDIVGRNASAVFADIQKVLDGTRLEPGYELKSGGQDADLQETIQGFLIAILLAVVLVYGVMACQFENFLHPFVIIFTLPLAFIGVALAMFMTQTTYSVPAFIGVVVLVGVVVNNAIVLIDYINQLRAAGKTRDEAIAIAGPVRLRPILMTTLTTVLGLVPTAMGWGTGGSQQAPMAIAVIGGLTVSTLLTLVVIPIVYAMFDDLQANVYKKLFSKSVG